MLRIALLSLLLVAASAHAQPKSRTGWLSDYAAARAEAKRTGKPLMVVFRCEPCGEHGAFDEQVTRLNPEIAAAADKFVRVRLTRITGVDLRLFEFDYDTAWFTFLMNADETVYGRFGGRDAGDADRRLSLKGLRFALDQALEAHKTPPPAIERAGKALTVSDFAAARKVKGGCVHCHNVNEFSRADAKAAGTFDREQFRVYPLPENVGLNLDVEQGNRVLKVAPESPAAKAGMQAGDLIRTLNTLPVNSLADASYALHKAGTSGSIKVTFTREGKPQAASLEVAEGWRKTNLSWRPSMLNFLPRLEFSGDELSPDERKALGLTATQVAFRQDKFVHSTLKAIGIVKDDVVVGIDGRAMDGNMKHFLSDVRGRYLVGDKATLNLLRDGKKLDVPITLK